MLILKCIVSVYMNILQIPGMILFSTQNIQGNGVSIVMGSFSFLPLLFYIADFIFFLMCIDWIAHDRAVRSSHTNRFMYRQLVRMWRKYCWREMLSLRFLSRLADSPLLVSVVTWPYWFFRIAPLLCALCLYLFFGSPQMRRVKPVPVAGSDAPVNDESFVALPEGAVSADKVQFLRIRYNICT